MNQLFNLIEKFKTGNASLEEQQILIELLSSNELELKKLMENEFYNNIKIDNLELSEVKSEAILKKILVHTEIVKELDSTRSNIIKTSFNWMQWIAAASIIVIIAIGSVYFSKSDKQENSSVNIKSNQPSLKEMTNKSKNVIAFNLSDGSTVTLSPNSSISYYQPFINNRNINLKGEAIFKVAKDPAKPFSVLANNIITTALGTIFKVSGSSQTVKVELLEGRVVVRPENSSVVMKDTYLKPGEQLSINKKMGTYAISNKLKNSKNISQDIVEPKTNNLTFNKSPLNEVISNIGNQFNVLIQYNKSDVQKLSFTGTFTSSDSLQTILSIICNTNDLVYKLDKGIVIISKQ
jgi:ferric-dicitrate binding protein FerR (iron transport regulator)